MKSCVNFLIFNQVSQTFNYPDFLFFFFFFFFFGSDSFQATWFWKCVKKTWPESQCLESSPCVEERGHASRASLSVSEKTPQKNGHKFDIFHLKHLWGFQGSSFNFSTWGIGGCMVDLPLNVQESSYFVVSYIK